MANLTISEGLALARAHMEQATPDIGKHPTSGDTLNHTLSYRWDFPTGGNLNVSIGFDVRSEDGVGVLVPKARVTGAVGTDAIQATVWARSVERIVLAAVEAEAIMREHHYRPDEEPVAHAQSTDVRNPYPTPACHAPMGKGDHVIHPDNAGRFRVTCGHRTCHDATLAHIASRTVREPDPLPRATATERARPAGPRRNR